MVNHQKGDYEYYICTYSWREFKKTRDVYSSNRDVFDNVSASLFGLENANAVPTGDLLRAPISAILKHLIKVTLIFYYQLVISNFKR